MKLECGPMKSSTIGNAGKESARCSKCILLQLNDLV